MVNDGKSVSFRPSFFGEINRTLHNETERDKTIKGLEFNHSLLIAWKYRIFFYYFNSIHLLIDELVDTFERNLKKKQWIDCILE